MKRFLIEDVKVGVSKGGVTCGNVGGSVVAEVCIRDTEKEIVRFHTLVETDGSLSIYESDVGSYDIHIREDSDDEKAWQFVSDMELGEYFNYDEFFEDLVNLKTCDEEHTMIWWYLVYLVRAGWEDIKKMKEMSLGRFLEEIIIPISDVEQEYQDRLTELVSENKQITEKEEQLFDEIWEDYVGNEINTDLVDLAEDDTYEGYYSWDVIIQTENNAEYCMKCGLDLDENGRILGVSKPICMKHADKKKVQCPNDEVGLEKVYGILRDELDGWL